MSSTEAGAGDGAGAGAQDDHNHNDNDDDDDITLIQRADELYKSERLLVAAKVLRKVSDVSLLEERHITMLRWADAVSSSMKDLLEDPFQSVVPDDDESGDKKEDGDRDKNGETTTDAATDADGDTPTHTQSTHHIPWKKQSETHGERDFVVFYHITDDNLLTSRIECPIESSLLIPILATFNESQLYETWMPSWKRPIKLGIDYTNKLKESGRGNQIIQVGVALAWPFSNRELCMHVVAVDSIQEDGCIAVHAMSETSDDDPVIPQVAKNVVRIDYTCSILIRACPKDHPCLTSATSTKKKKTKKNSNNNDDGNNDDDDNNNMVLFSLKMTADPHVKAVPQSLQNFVTRTVIGRFWSSMLHVAEEVRDGHRPLHQQAIESKRELYDWITSRVEVMIAQMENMK